MPRNSKGTHRCIRRSSIAVVSAASAACGAITARWCRPQDCIRSHQRAAESGGSLQYRRTQPHSPGGSSLNTRQAYEVREGIAALSHVLSAARWVIWLALHVGIVDISAETAILIARQSTWQGRVNHDGRGSRGSRSMLQLIVAGKLLLVALLRS